MVGPTFPSAIADSLLVDEGILIIELCLKFVPWNSEISIYPSAIGRWRTKDATPRWYLTGNHSLSPQEERKKTNLFVCIFICPNLSNIWEDLGKNLLFSEFDYDVAGANDRYSLWAPRFCARTPGGNLLASFCREGKIFELRRSVRVVSTWIDIINLDAA